MKYFPCEHWQHVHFNLHLDSIDCFFHNIHKSKMAHSHIFSLSLFEYPSHCQCHDNSCLPFALYDCSKVRRKEGSGQGWLVKTQVFLFKADKLTQVRTLRHPETSTLSFVSAITLCIRSDCFSLTARAPESSLCLSLWTAVPRRLLSGLHANYCNQTQVILILHLTHLLTAVSWVFLPLQTSLNHAPLATYPHRPTQAGKPSGLQPPPPHFWRGSRLQSSASPACGSPWIWRAVMPDTNGWSARWYPSCGGATARGRGPNRGWIPVPGDNSGGWGPPTGSPNTPSQWCCTSSLS